MLNSLIFLKSSKVLSNLFFFSKFKTTHVHQLSFEIFRPRHTEQNVNYGCRGCILLMSQTLHVVRMLLDDKVRYYFREFF